MAISRQAQRTAVLLINLGTPDAPTAAAVKPYLKQFLSDPRVVEIPKVIWWCILNLIILPIRSGASAKNMPVFGCLVLMVGRHYWCTQKIRPKP